MLPRTVEPVLTSWLRPPIAPRRSPRAPSDGCGCSPCSRCSVRVCWPGSPTTTRPASPPTRCSGPKYGYQLLWVLLLSTVALVLFHELGARMGVVTGQGLIGLIRQRYGVRLAALATHGARGRQPRHHLRRVRRHRGRVRAVRREPLPERPAGRRARVGAGPARQLPPRRARPDGASAPCSSPTSPPGFLAHPDWRRRAQGLVVPTHAGHPRRRACSPRPPSGRRSRRGA